MLWKHVYRSRQIIMTNRSHTGPSSNISEGTFQRNAAQPRRLGRRRLIGCPSRIPFALFAVLALSIAVLRFNEHTSASHSGQTAVSTATANTDRITAFVDILDDIIALLEDIADDLADANALIGPETEPLQEPTKTAVANLLDNAEALIDQILDSNEYPSLTPADAGSVDPSFAPTTLPEYATDSNDLAVDALQEALSRIVDDAVIGTDLKTIKGLLPGYRQEAGI